MFAGTTQPCRRVTSLTERLLLSDNAFRTLLQYGRDRAALVGFRVKRLKVVDENETFKTPPNNNFLFSFFTYSYYSHFKFHFAAVRVLQNKTGGAKFPWVFIRIHSLHQETNFEVQMSDHSVYRLCVHGAIYFGCEAKYRMKMNNCRHFRQARVIGLQELIGRTSNCLTD